MDIDPFDRYEALINGIKYITPETKQGDWTIVLQNRDELRAFVEVLKNEPRTSAIEIGLAFGGTHLLWRHLYQTVVTVEGSEQFVDSFLKALQPCEQYVPGGTNIFLSDSRNPTLPGKIKTMFGQFDMLFIDGNHSYEYVKSDHELYAPLVHEGGIVAFHDSIGHHLGVPRYLSELPVELNRIEKSKDLGIAWYRK